MKQCCFIPPCKQRHILYVTATREADATGWKQGGHISTTGEKKLAHCILKNDWDLEPAHIQSGSTIKVIVSKPPVTCAECEQDDDIDVNGLLSESDDAASQCRRCLQRYCHTCCGHPAKIECPKCGSAGDIDSHTAFGSRSAWEVKWPSDIGPLSLEAYLFFYRQGSRINTWFLKYCILYFVRNFMSSV